MLTCRGGGCLVRRDRWLVGYWISCWIGCAWAWAARARASPFRIWFCMFWVTGMRLATIWLFARASPWIWFCIFWMTGFGRCLYCVRYLFNNDAALWWLCSAVSTYNNGCMMRELAKWSTGVYLALADDRMKVSSEATLLFLIRFCTCPFLFWVIISTLFTYHQWWDMVCLLVSTLLISHWSFTHSSPMFFHLSLHFRVILQWQQLAI
jgi:hypothetical protein